MESGPTELRQRGRNGLRAKDHAGTAAVGVVVHGAVPADAPPPQVVDADLRQPALEDAARDALPQRPLDHRGEEGEDLDLEGHQPDGATPGPEGRPPGVFGGFGAFGAAGVFGGFGFFLGRRSRGRT